MATGKEVDNTIACGALIPHTGGSLIESGLGALTQNISVWAISSGTTIGRRDVSGTTPILTGNAFAVTVSWSTSTSGSHSTSVVTLFQ